MELLTTKTEFIELRAKGYSFDKIAKKLGKAKQTLIDWSKELEEEIANLKALELETLYEKHYLSKQSRLESFGTLLNNLKEEIVTRDLSDVPTDKLLDLYLKFNNQIQEEIVEPRFKTSQEIKEEEMDKQLLEELTTPNYRRLKTV